MPRYWWITAATILLVTAPTQARGELRGDGTEGNGPAKMSTVVFTPGLDFAFGSEGNQGHLQLAFNVRSGDINVYFEPRMTTTLIGDGLPDQNAKGDTAWMWLLNTELYVGKVLKSKQYTTSEGYIQETGRQRVSMTTERVSYRTTSIDAIPAVEEFVAEAGVLTHPVGFGPLFSRIYHPAVGLRWFDHYDVYVMENGARTNWTRHALITAHIIGPGIVMPGFTPNPPLAEASLPIGIAVNYDVRVKKRLTVGCRFMHLPGYNTMLRFDLKWPFLF